MDVEDLKNRLGIAVNALENWYFGDERCKKTLLDHFHVSSLAGLGLGELNCGIIAAGALLQYLMETQKTAIANLTSLNTYFAGKYMVIDSSTRRNLDFAKLYVKSRKEVPFCGFSIRQRLRWGQDFCVPLLSSR